MGVNSGLASLSFETVSIADVTPSAHNPRRYPKRIVKTLARLIRECGFVLPILVDERGVVVHGEALYRAARELGLAQVPVVRASHLTDEQKRLLTVALERLGELGEWDRDQLATELTFLNEFSFPDLTGFEVGELDLILEADEERHRGPTLDDDVPDLQAGRSAVAREGEVWRLGDHGLLCADARDTAALTTLMAGEQVTMVLTDPPYNVPISGHVTGKGKTRHREFAFASGEMSEEAFTAFLETSFRAHLIHLADGAALYVFMDWRHLHELITATRRVGLPLVNLCVWNKTNGGMGSLYRSKHELILVLKHGSARHRNNVELGRHGRNRTNVWDYAGVNTFRAGRGGDLAMHPTTKPVAMLADAIKDVTCRGDIVLDPFLGSGSTVIAAEKTGRRARTVELDPLYVDVAIRRWQKFTGKQAVLATSGDPFEDVEAARECSERHRSEES